MAHAQCVCAGEGQWAVSPCSALLTLGMAKFTFEVETQVLYI